MIILYASCCLLLHHAKLIALSHETIVVRCLSFIECYLVAQLKLITVVLVYRDYVLLLHTVVQSALFHAAFVVRCLIFMETCGHALSECGYLE